MRLVHVAAAAIAGVAVLAGCSDGQSANETLPSTSASAAQTTASLPPLGPPDLPMPNEARRDTSEGAAAFTGYYLALINRTNAVMDSQYLRQFARSCETCGRIADETDADAAAGYRYVGGELKLDGALNAAITKPGNAEAAFLLDQAALQVVDRAGTPVPDLSFPALDDLSSGAATTWDQGLQSWVMQDLTLG
ncbi:DUF6318 family protein [Modestobacter italicus]|uniref:DUF6318 family protein n=1 Tax=Modestobacter italicus (strain DSM 44449 / CECT 9708 / BC 501) TaxID=2732864 RepID=UPI0014125775|nr:DUF6318 family protein [Modestobacter marinus]